MTNLNSSAGSGKGLSCNECNFGASGPFEKYKDVNFPFVADVEMDIGASGKRLKPIPSVARHALCGLCGLLLCVQSTDDYLLLCAQDGNVAAAASILQATPFDHLDAAQEAIVEHLGGADVIFTCWQPVDCSHG